MPFPPKITLKQISLWAQEPGPLTDYQSSSNLPEEVDIVIIGSGFSGASTAFHLLERQETANPVDDNDPLKRDWNDSCTATPKVLMLEARKVCSGATGRNGGHLQPDYLSHFSKHSEEEAAQLAKFEYLNYHHLLQLVKLSNGAGSKLQPPLDCSTVDPDSEQHCGWLSYTDPEAFRTALENIAKLRVNCPDIANSLQVYDDSVIAQQQLGVKYPVVGAVCVPASPVNPYKLTTWLLLRSLLNGLYLYTHTLVTRIDRDRISTKKRGFLITTSRGTIRASKVVLATNAYTPAIHGISKLVKQIFPVRGQVSCYRLNKKSIKLPISSGSHLSMDWGEEYIASIPDDERPNDKVLVVVGGARRYARDKEIGLVDDNVYNESLSKTLNEFVKTSLGFEVPKEGLQPIAQWTGIMGFSEKPLIGQLPDGVHIIAGFSGHGMPRIFLSALALAGSLHGKPSPSWFPKSYELDSAQHK